jgi:hypothetical protein
MPVTVITVNPSSSVVSLGVDATKTVTLNAEAQRVAATSSVALLATTASFAVSASWAQTYLLIGDTTQSISSSYSVLATSASYALTASYVSGAASTWDSITQKPTGLVSSSIQINTGSYSGSLIGTSSWANSASIATQNIITASVSNTTITFTKGNGTTFDITVAQSGSVATASYATLAQSAVTASYVGQTAFATSASYAPTILPVGTVSSSLQINTGSFSGSITSASYAVTSAYTNVGNGTPNTFAVWSTNTTLTGSVVQQSASMVNISSSLNVSGTAHFANDIALYRNLATNDLAFVVQRDGHLLELDNEQSSLRLRNVLATSGGVEGSRIGSVGGSLTLMPTDYYEANEKVTIGFWDTNNLINTAIEISNTASISSGSLRLMPSGGVVVVGADPGGTQIFRQTGDTRIVGTVSASFFVGNGANLTNLTSASYAATASVARSASYAPVILPTGIVSSSAQINTGSFSGSFVGTASWATAAISATLAVQNIVTASASNTTITFTKGDGSTFSVTVAQSGSVASSSYAAYAENTNLFDGLDSSVFVTTGSNTFIGTEIISGTLQVTGGITGSMLGTSSWAANSTTSSIANAIQYTNILNRPTLISSSVQINTGSFSGSFIGTSSWSSNAVSASFATTASYAMNGGADWSVITGKPTGLVSSSVQINTGSFTGSFTGSLLGTASWAANTNTASYFSGTLDFPNGLTVTGSTLSTTGFTGSLSGSALTATSASYAATASLLLGSIVSSSYALTASYAMNGGGSGISSSYATSASHATIATTASYISGGINFTNGLTVTGSLIVTGGITGSLSGSIQSATSASYALTASYAMNGGGASDWNSITGKPTGLVSSSTQINTGSFTGSFTGSITSASYALTSSYTSVSEWGLINGKPIGIVSSSGQINTGSFSGSFIGTSSWASFAVTASYLTGNIQFSNGLVVTGSTISTAGFTGSLSGSALTATSASYANAADELTKITFTVSAALSPSFARITSGAQHLSNSTYVISSIINDSVYNNYRISGILSWYTGSVSSSGTDELFLHRVGATSADSIFLRTNSVSGSTIFLEMCSTTSSISSSYTFTFVKLA